MLAKFVGFATKAMRVSDPSGLSSCFLYENRLQVVDLQPIFAERQGFEPWVPVRVQRFSRPSRSTTPASFLGVLRRQNYKLFWTLQNSFAFFCHLIPIVVNNSLTACDILSLCRLRHFMNNDPIMAPDELPKASCSVAGLDIPNPMSLLCCSGMRLMRLK